jgi:hypothetical protein
MFNLYIFENVSNFEMDATQLAVCLQHLLLDAQWTGPHATLIHATPHQFREVKNFLCLENYTP